MSNATPVLLWLRRGDLRLRDNPALAAAAASGHPVIPLFLRERAVNALGAAPAWRLAASLAGLSADLEALGSRLVLRSGEPSETLPALVEETGARAVYLTRQAETALCEGDATLIRHLKAAGVATRDFAGNLLFEPGSVTVGQGGPYKVFTPFWNAVRGRDVPSPAGLPSRLASPETWPASDDLADWTLGAGMKRGAAVLERHVAAGEAAASAQLEAFLEDRIDGYGSGRDQLDRQGCSGLSAYLATGEIGVRQCWHAALRLREGGSQGAEAFLRQLAWRDFAWHFRYFRPDFPANDEDRFDWDRDEDRAEVLAWKQGRTGIPLVDAGMREMQVTGTMHNRTRMVAASFLTKHLLADWRIGMRWFEQHLVDWDAANNAFGWQWVAGVGPFSAPFNRVFNPALQADKFDPQGRYRDRWIAEGQRQPPQTALDFFVAVPLSWKLSPQDRYPTPIVSLEAGRRRALTAWEDHKSRRAKA